MNKVLTIEAILGLPLIENKKTGLTKENILAEYEEKIKGDSLFSIFYIVDRNKDDIKVRCVKCQYFDSDGEPITAKEAINYYNNKKITKTKDNK